MPRRRVVTERDVREAIADRLAALDARDAAVTPSAIDLAHAMGITLLGLAGERGKVRTGGKPVPACGARGDGAGEGAVDRSANPRAPVPPASGTLRIAVGADHGGVALKDAIAAHLRELGHAVVDHGTTGSAAVDYPDFALAVARSVSAGAAEFGIMVDGAGSGSCMVANKVAGVRAAMCHDVTTARNAREHNNANLLTLGGGLIGARLALEIVRAFLDTPFGGGRHEARVAKIDALDRAGDPVPDRQSHSPSSSPSHPWR
jgi:ribose 5-phosphate isomerase B